MVFFIEEHVCTFNIIKVIFSLKETKHCFLSENGDGAQVLAGFSEYPPALSSLTLKFTGRVFFYINVNLGLANRLSAVDEGERMGYNAVVREREYAALRSSFEKPLAFISHDSRDKEALVRELAIGMSKALCPVWYDEYSLKVGDSLRENIERGLKEARKCIVVLSPNFLSNSGWGKAEFKSIFTREIVEKQNLILPIWHEVSIEQVFNYSPLLADRVGLSSSLGIKELTSRIVAAIRS